MTEIDIAALVERLNAGADFYESEHDIGMPMLLREAAAALTHLGEERDAAVARQDGQQMAITMLTRRAEKAELEHDLKAQANDVLAFQVDDLAVKLEKAEAALLDTQERLRIQRDLTDVTAERAEKAEAALAVAIQQRDLAELKRADTERMCDGALAEKAEADAIRLATTLSEIRMTLASNDIVSLPHDYPTQRMAQDRMGRIKDLTLQGLAEIGRREKAEAALLDTQERLSIQRDLTDVTAERAEKAEAKAAFLRAGSQMAAQHIDDFRKLQADRDKRIAELAMWMEEALAAWMPDSVKAEAVWEKCNALLRSFDND